MNLTEMGGQWYEPSGESTSARLRRVEQERDQARGMCFAAENDLTHLRRERDQLRADLTAAFDELQQLRYSGWLVARDGGRTCAACPHEIRRGEAYSVDATGDQLAHVHCPQVTP